MCEAIEGFIGIVVRTATSKAESTHGFWGRLVPAHVLVFPDEDRKGSVTKSGTEEVKAKHV